MTILDLASAHLETIRTRINQLLQQQNTVATEIQRLNEILEEGTRLVENHIKPSDNSTVN